MVSSDKGGVANKVKKRHIQSRFIGLISLRGASTYRNPILTPSLTPQGVQSSQWAML